MNRKGFTLIELLAVIVVLALILVITFPNLTNVLKNSKLKNEQIFVDRLSQTIDSYVSLNIGTISFSSNPISAKKIIRAGEYQYVTVYQGTITVNDLIKDNIISSNDYINPSNKKICNPNTEIEVYRDSDYVYCHKVKKDNDNIDCLSDEFRGSIDGDYVIDTCVWTLDE
ncbi:MAG: type II secretion system protein [Bacilli bacterium]